MLDVESHRVGRARNDTLERVDRIQMAAAEAAPAARAFRDILGAELARDRGRTRRELGDGPTCSMRVDRIQLAVAEAAPAARAFRDILGAELARDRGRTRRELGDGPTCSSA